MNKQSIRNTVRAHVLQQMRKGALNVGRTINLAALSRQLGVSVTPIREALAQLEQAQIIKAVPNRGFVISGFDEKEARNLYETVAQLEVIAMENTSYEKSMLQQLKKLQLELQQTHTPQSRLAARFHFHALLIAPCKNKILVQILDDLKTRILFYEQAYIRDASVYERIDNQNESIISAIEENNIPTAALILKMNWMVVLDYLERQMQEK
ncbi:MAG: GntR family transcriptional regulator [Bacteroidota bacterium]